MRVLDASVLIAAVLKEPGGKQAIEAEGQRCTSAVNLAEARTRLVDQGMTNVQIDKSVELLDTLVVPFTEQDAVLAAALRSETRKIGLSLGDRACLALAQRLDGIAVTADRVWKDLGLPIEISLIR